MSWRRRMGKNVPPPSKWGQGAGRTSEARASLEESVSGPPPRHSGKSWPGVKLHRVDPDIPIVQPTTRSPWVWAVKGVVGEDRARSPDLAGSYVHPRTLGYELPKRGLPEMAFAGRSNVGKSSLVGALMGDSSLVRCSKTPGCTRVMQYFGIQPRAAQECSDRFTYYLVDLPGYGYSARSRKESKRWGPVVRDYLLGGTCSRVFVLVDAKRGMTDHDEDICKQLGKAAVPYQVVVTKVDLLRGREVAPLVNSIARRVSHQPACYPLIHVTSSRVGYGLGELRDTLWFIKEQVCGE